MSLADLYQPGDAQNLSPFEESYMVFEID